MNTSKNEPTISVRQATSDDIDTIVAFNCGLASETESKTLDQTTLRAGVAQLIADPRKGSYWIAEVDGQSVGQVMYTFEWSDWRNGMFWWIQSVYVRPAYRR